MRNVAGWGRHWTCPARTWARQTAETSVSHSPPRAFLAAALAQGLCEVLLVVTKEVEEAGCWLHTS